MNGVVCSVGNCNKIVRIQDARISGLDLLQRDRVQMMDIQTLMNLVPIDSQVASVISNDYSVPSLPPFSGSVKGLISPPIETESRLSNYAPKR